MGRGGHRGRIPYSRGWVAVPLPRSVLAPRWCRSVIYGGRQREARKKTKNKKQRKGTKIVIFVFPFSFFSPLAGSSADPGAKGGEGSHRDHSEGTPCPWLRSAPRSGCRQPRPTTKTASEAHF